MVWICLKGSTCPLVDIPIGVFFPLIHGDFTSQKLFRLIWNTIKWDHYTEFWGKTAKDWKRTDLTSTNNVFYLSVPCEHSSKSQILEKRNLCECGERGKGTEREEGSARSQMRR